MIAEVDYIDIGCAPPLRGGISPIHLSSATKEKADMALTESITPTSSEQDAVHDVNKVDGSKNGATGVVEVMDLEEGESQKTFYSKVSVVMMVIFSGLAIGSDG